MKFCELIFFRSIKEQNITQQTYLFIYYCWGIFHKKKVRRIVEQEKNTNLLFTSLVSNS